VNVLAGINGGGKSTILDHIYKLISGDEFSKPYLVKEFKVYFNTGDFVCMKKIYRKDIAKNLEKAAKKGDLIARLTLGAVNTEYSQSSIIEYDGAIFDSSKFKSEELKTVINKNIIKTFDANAKPEETLQKVDTQVKTELDLELWLMQKEYMKYQIRIYKYGSDINRNTHIRFLAMIDELFSETQKKVNPNKEGLEFLLGDKEINAYQLSSGEKQLLIILLTVLVQDNKPAILLMDEPETSLHIEWQRKLIKYIRELNPNAQIIIATHSPDIIIKGWLDKVVNIEDIIVKDNAVA
jgi:energy-coupling factor transporter ATP-binding protein EcfA2